MRGQGSFEFILALSLAIVFISIFLQLEGRLYYDAGMHLKDLDKRIGASKLCVSNKEETRKSIEYDKIDPVCFGETSFPTGKRFR